MTQNQLKFHEIKEDMRSNLAKETETNRANLAKETETHRSNVANETENNRHNVETESATRQKNKWEHGDRITSTLVQGLFGKGGVSGTVSNLVPLLLI